jgi:AcrR family transcriptional regulator
MIRRDRNRREMRDLILDAARKIVVESGVSSLSMRAVARAIGYSPAALYEYFPSKAILSQALFFEGAEGLSGKIRSTLESLEPGTHPGLAVRQLGIAYREFALDNRELYLLVFTNPVTGFEPDEQDRQAATGGYDLLVEAMHRGVASGDLPAVDPNIAALAAWSVVHGFVMLEMLGYIDGAPAFAGDDTFNALLDHVSLWNAPARKP